MGHRQKANRTGMVVVRVPCETGLVLGGFVTKKNEINWTINRESHSSESALSSIPPPAARSRFPKDCGATPSVAIDQSFPDV